ncbi:putative ankyrin repeat-containing domain-containing protein [Helianthus annuus]|uniref:Ankyrin repeat-containing domain-containing protein n=1 Tax=Helianthus annuus TaxID=4232 RepID=A0A251UUL1_HELAN|nr:putative ankyrin repeat-containing domain-containing protein [Helianthus annuus]
MLPVIFNHLIIIFIKNKKLVQFDYGFPIDFVGDPICMLCVDFQDAYSLTTVHMAAKKGHKDVVMLLVEFAPDLKHTND